MTKMWEKGAIKYHEPFKAQDFLTSMDRSNRLTKVGLR